LFVRRGDGVGWIESLPVDDGVDGLDLLLLRLCVDVVVAVVWSAVVDFRHKNGGREITHM
jgi:hypothetical protein